MTRSNGIITSMRWDRPCWWRGHSIYVGCCKCTTSCLSLTRVRLWKSSTFWGSEISHPESWTTFGMCSVIMKCFSQRKKVHHQLNNSRSALLGLSHTTLSSLQLRGIWTQPEQSRRILHSVGVSRGSLRSPHRELGKTMSLPKTIEPRRSLHIVWFLWEVVPPQVHEHLSRGGRLPQKVCLSLVQTKILNKLIIFFSE